MKQINVVLATLLLAAAVPVAVAQHGGHGGAPSGGGSAPWDDSKMRDFRRALSLSATEEQRAAFARCMEATDRALSIADGMAGLSTGSNYDAAVLTERKGQLQAALAELEATHQHFQHSLNQPQEKELRRYLAKLERLQADMSKRLAQIDRDLSIDNPDLRRLQGDTRKMKEGVEKWKSEHRKIADDMGIGEG